MEKCVLCEFDIRDCFCDFDEMVKLACNDNFPNPEAVVYMPSYKDFPKRHSIQRASIVLENLMPCSRQNRAEQFSKILDSFEGEVFDQNSIYIDHRELCPWKILGFLGDNLDEGDPSGWWIGNTKKWKDNPPKMITEQMRKRFVLVYVVISIKYPQIAKRLI